MASLYRLEKVAKLIRNHNLVMFSKTFCPFCLKAKATFEEIGVSEMKVVELDESDDGDSLQVLSLWATEVHAVNSIHGVLSSLGTCHWYQHVQY